MLEVQSFRMATPRRTVIRVKRWVYARFYVPAELAGQRDLAEKNKREWIKVACLLIDRLSKLGSESVVRIRIAYDTKVHGYVNTAKHRAIRVEEFIPLEVKIEVYEKKAEESLPLR